MFERFTERARKVVTLAQEEAIHLGSESVGTGHLLVGLIQEDEGIASQALERCGITLDIVRKHMDFGAQVGMQDQLPFTPLAKETFNSALREALSLGHNYIGTEHILLGLLRANPALLEPALDTQTLRDEVIRDEVIRLLTGTSQEKSEPEQPEEYSVRVRCTNCGFCSTGPIKIAKGRPVHEHLCPNCEVLALEGRR